MKLSSQTSTVADKKLTEHSDDVFVFPTSFAQQRLWFLDQLEPDSPTYNVSSASYLDGSLNVTVLEQSLNEIVRRHEALRTTFVAEEGQPLQTVAPILTLTLPVFDLREMPETGREVEARRLATEEARRPFDLSQGPLLRATLLRLDEEHHVLLLTIHHIICDRWSLEVFFRELSILYEAFSTGKLAPLPELSIQYADFAVWQRQQLQGEVLEEQLSYWKEKLAGSLPSLDLPTDRPRLTTQTHQGAYQSLMLPKTLFESFKALCLQEEVTMFMALLAAFEALLYRYTGQEDILIGTPIANRGQVEIEGLIGFFLNTLALRIDLSGAPTFRELLRRVREVCLEAYVHQDLPFEKLVEELQPERDLSHSPLFQVMFVQTPPTQTLELPGLTKSPLEVDNGTAKFALTLFVEEESGGLKTAFEYSTDLFDAATIQRMLGHYQTLLESITADPDQRIGTLPLLTKAERHQMLVEWNDTQTDYPEDLCVHQLFEAQVERTPDATAVEFRDQQLMYRELNARANQLAHYLKKHRVGPDELVGICVERSLEMVVGVLGILKAGGAYVPLDPTYPKERLAFMLEDTKVPVLLTQEQLMAELSEHKAQVIRLDTDWEIIAQESDKNPVSGAMGEHLVYVLYTSGSTGQPKGVALPHRAVGNLIVWQLFHTTLPEGARMLQFSSLSFDASFTDIFMTLCSGGTLVIVADSTRRDIANLARFIADQRIERLNLPFVALQHLAGVQDAQEQVPLSVKEVISTAEQLQVTQSVRRLFEQLPDCSLHNQYGPTESHVVTVFTLEGSPSDWLALPHVGRPIANTQIYILDRYLQPVPIGVVGGLYIGGIGLARGYLNRPDLTKEKFIPNPFDTDPDARLYKTGDLARYLPDGNIEFLGRIDHQVKIRGFRVEPGEIETVLGQHPSVRQVVVLAREDESGDPSALLRAGKRLVAYIVPHQGAPPTTSELRDFLKQKLPDYMVPSLFVMLDELPLTPSGKVDRRALPAPDRTRPEQEEAFVAPRTPSEEALAGIWSEVLGLKQIGIHDNFFELGGHSLLATRVISRIRNTFQVELPLRCIFETPTITQLAVEIEKAKEAHGEFVPSRIEPISREVYRMKRSPAGELSDE